MARPKAGSPSKKQKAGKGKKGTRKTKDPNAPKKPTTAFFYFVKSRRDQGLDQGMKVADFTKECGALWQELKDRTKFDKLAQSDRERYEKEMKAYKPSGAGGSGDEPPKPKKASTAFILFANAKRADLMAEGFSAKEVLQEAGRMWKEMKDKDKSEFVAAADEDRKRYNKDMEKYEELRNSKKNGAKKPAPKKPPSDDEDEDDDDDDDEDMESDDE